MRISARGYANNVKMTSLLVQCQVHLLLELNAIRHTLARHRPLTGVLYMQTSNIRRNLRRPPSWWTEDLVQVADHRYLQVYKLVVPGQSRVSDSGKRNVKGGRLGGRLTLHQAKEDSQKVHALSTAVLIARIACDWGTGQRSASRRSGAWVGARGGGGVSAVTRAALARYSVPRPGARPPRAPSPAPLGIAAIYVALETGIFRITSLIEPVSHFDKQRTVYFLENLNLGRGSALRRDDGCDLYPRERAEGGRPRRPGRLLRPRAGGEGEEGRDARCDRW
ncbi:hypothetical protein EVAR_51651_1 [Eumeta japonica]|uniref:Uncharacterized protein n=1 Tax=Eumeta variegata TaxID=151549 RepID=A0A4C1YHF9_EUMVA|nr:hypothetical protein EVAR_51651_1 [Eumeta japonica]